MERRWSWIRIRVGVSPLVILHFKSRDRARAVYFHGTSPDTKPRKKEAESGDELERGGAGSGKTPAPDARRQAGGVHPIFPRLSSPPHSGDCSNGSNIEAFCADFFASCAVLKHGNARPFFVNSESNMGVLVLKIFNTK